MLVPFFSAGLWVSALNGSAAAISKQANRIPYSYAFRKSALSSDIVINVPLFATDLRQIFAW